MTLAVNVDARRLDAIEGEVSTSPGTADLQTDPGSPPEGADAEPQTLEPPRKMGVPRLRAPTIMGVAPPSSGGKGPPPTSSQSSTVPGVPKISHEGEDEQTTLVGKLLAEAHAEVSKRLKDRPDPKDPDLYQDETATTVGDAEKLIAAANAAAFGKANEDAIEENDEPTESRAVADAFNEDVTSKRDAINVDSALARAAELRAEAEARKKRAMKKRTMHGLGDGPLRLPASPSQDDIPTFDNKVETKRDRESERLATTPADGEMETLSAVAPLPAPMRAIRTEPETIQVPVPSRERQSDRQMQGANNHAATLVAGHAPPAQPLPTGPMQPLPAPPPTAFAPNTHPMTYPSTMRMDENGGGVVDPLRATMQASPGNGAYPQSPHALHGTPPGGVPHYPSTPLPGPTPFATGPHQHLQAEAFARTAVATGSGPAVLPEEPKKKGKGGLLFFLLVLGAIGVAGYWQRAHLKPYWERYRPAMFAPPPPAPSVAPSTTPADSAAASASASASAAPSASVSASASASAAPSASVAPSASSSAGPRASASSSASSKPPAKKPPPWKPWKPKPKPSGPKPIDNDKGF